jgi:mono/diheme cytochrome c family protein
MLAVAVLAAGLCVATGQESAPPAIFTRAQAEAGRVAFENTCGQCHTPKLTGRKGDPGELPPISSLSAEYQKFIGPRGYVRPLVGKEFLDRWGMVTAAQLIARFQETVSQFPPEGMNDETTVNITAYVMQANGAKAGNKALTRATDVVVNSTIR